MSHICSRANYSKACGISTFEMRPPKLDPETGRSSGPRPEAADRGPSDGELFALSLVDPAAFAGIFDRHWESIRAYCVSRGGSAGEDIAAEVFRIAFDRRGEYDPAHDDAAPWLFGIATNLLRRHFRSGRRGHHALRRLAAMVGRGEDRAEEADIGALEARSLGSELTAALRATPAADREALLLLAWAELDYAEIAAALQIPLGTVRSRIHRARERVRHHLDERKHDEHRAP